MFRKICLSLLFCIFFNLGYTQPFILGPSTVGGSGYGIDWGDCDNDGDLDLLVAGGASITDVEIYRNVNGLLLWDIAPGIPELFSFADVQWCDFDNNGILDYILSGNETACPASPLLRGSHIFLDNRNFPSYTDIGAGLQGGKLGCNDWGDFNNDGKADLALSGSESTNNFTTRIYLNKGDSMISTGTIFPALYEGTVRWGDYDNDQDLDLYLSGDIYSNDGGLLTPLGTGIDTLRLGDADWGDYDADGDLDLVIAGSPASYIADPRTLIYRNDSGGVFTQVIHNIPGVHWGTVTWADYDNDGDLDIFVAGDTTSAANDTLFIAKLYRNDGANFFTDAGIGLAGTNRACARWGDIDNDGDLDLSLTGKLNSSPYIIGKVLLNQLSSANANTLPLVPTGLVSTVTGYNVQINWNKSTDNETPQNALSYNIMMGTMPGGINICSPLSDINTGYRKRADMGNTCLNNGWWLKDLVPGPYWWSVQTIDQTLAGSLFAPLDSFVVFDTLAPTLHYPLIDASDVNCDTVARWYAFPGAINYHIQVATDSSFVNVVFDDPAVPDTGVAISFQQLKTTYFWRVCANINGGPSPWSFTRQFSTLPHFSEITMGFPEIGGTSSWGDYDNDGDMDVAFSGYSAVSLFYSEIFQNSNGSFAAINSGIDTANGEIEWGDYDNDGDLDLAIFGSAFSGFLKIYNNNNGIFTDAFGNLFMPANYNDLDFEWGDYDNDGDLDFVIMGPSGSRIFRNDDSTFTNIGANILDMEMGTAAWGDYDNDKDLDLLMTGAALPPNNQSKLYRNDNGIFVDLNAPIISHERGAARWADFDNDSDLDFAIVGDSPDWHIYRNDSGSFNLHQTIAGYHFSYADLTWGDFDNDGDPDIAIGGSASPDHSTMIFRNDGGIFSVLDNDFLGVAHSNIQWVDFDNDHDLDLFVTGSTEFQGPSGIYRKSSKLYRNNICQPNTPPLPPTILSAVLDIFTGNFSFNWSGASDAETPGTGLSYNFYAGTASVPTSVSTPMADLGTGYRKVVRLGNANTNYGWNLDSVATGTYFWSVQSIDHNFEASVFSPVQSVTIINTFLEEPITAGLTVFPNPTSGIYNLYVTGKTGEKIEISLYDMTGKTIFEQEVVAISNVSIFTFDHSQLQKGHYVVNCRSAGANRTFKLLLE